MQNSELTKYGFKLINGTYTLKQFGVIVEYMYTFVFYSFDILRNDYYKVFLQKPIDNINEMVLMYKLLTGEDLKNE